MTAPNPWLTISALSLCLDLCQNDEVYVRGRGRYEAEWIRLIAAAMSCADRFVDVGANVGAYALAVAQAFPEKKVVAIEPLPEVSGKLAEAIALNGLRNVTVIRGVVADHEGTVTFHVNPLSDGAGSLQPFTAYRTGDIEIDAAEYQRRRPGFAATLGVDAVPLDALLEESTVLKVEC